MAFFPNGISYLYNKLNNLRYCQLNNENFFIILCAYIINLFVSQHPQFIFQLDRPVRLADNVRIAKVNLPKNVPYGTWDTYEGETATIAGFGAHGIELSSNKEGQTVEIGDRSFPGQLLIARADVLPQRDCEDIFSGFLSIHMVHMCAQMHGTDYRGVCTVSVVVASTVPTFERTHVCVCIFLTGRRGQRPDLRRHHNRRGELRQRDVQRD